MLRSHASPVIVVTLMWFVVYAGVLPSDAKADGAEGLSPVPIQNVQIDDGFWSPKIAVWRATTINDVFTKFETHGAFENFDRVAAKKVGGHHGEPWWDGLIYETITASADFLAAQSNPALQKRVEGYVSRIAAAAEVDPDGYVNTDATLDHIGIRWSDPPAAGDKHEDSFPHTVYNAGCLVEAGVHLYRATGDTRLLQVATRMANYMCGIMGPPPKQNIVPGHAISELSFVELYRLYREQPALKAKVGLTVTEGDYLKLAEFWVENRGHTDGRDSRGVYNQDDRSVFEQPALEGHAVRAGLLATGIAAAANVNGRDDYRETGVRWWKNMVRAKMYVTGGLGSIPSTEGFGADYHLPNQGYTETCASAAAGFFSHQMNLLTGEGKYMDGLERELYNGALSGVSLEGNAYFYTNFLNAGPDHRRWDWQSGAVNVTPCCPPMFLKLQSALPGYLYATDAKGVYVNLYAGSHAQIDFGGEQIALRQTTAYPWDGTVKIEVVPRGVSMFALNLRVPAWARNVSVEVNGETAPLNVVKHYARVEREWKAGDVVVLHLPMPVERVKADPRVAADVGRVALMRGPIVYCMEGQDNGGHVSNLFLPPNDPIEPETHAELLGGVVTLRGNAFRVQDAGEGTSQQTPTRFTAVPFYANSNRAPTDLAVWIADDVAHARPLTLAGEGVASASHCNASDTVLALNDDIEPKSSDDNSIPRLTWWDHRGTQEWAQLTFKDARPLSGVDVYWWDERRVGRDCRVPESWTVQYLATDGGWKTVEAASGFGTQMDGYNHVEFRPVTTTALRLAVQLQSQWSGGILEWRVEDKPVEVARRR